MSGFDLPPLSGFDLKRPMGFDPASLPELAGRLPASFGDGAPGVQDPERLLAPDGGGGRRHAGESFGGILADSLARVDALQRDVQAKTRGMALGEGVELHDVLVAANKSEVAFNLLLEVRNKLVDAWEKLSRSAV
ncbi:MAG: flagellar hook-basal body complex protein FliE [Planctomycetes bacterium]|nr:flagellar hook-basal body complex protein FliE [Planctomycetota bacterium]